MQYQSYLFNQSANPNQFFFESIGSKGVIHKAVIFSLIIEPNIYNLALGDRDILSGELNDQLVSDNGDTAEVLATVFHITQVYLSMNPTHRVYFEGNTPARNRLYRMAISRARKELSNHFTMFGLCLGSWEEFSSNRPYESFLIQKKYVLQ